MAIDVFLQDFVDEESASQYAVDGSEYPGFGQVLPPSPTTMLRGRAPEPLPNRPPLLPQHPLRPGFRAPYAPPG